MAFKPSPFAQWSINAFIGANNPSLYDFRYFLNFNPRRSRRAPFQVGFISRLRPPIRAS